MTHPTPPLHDPPHPTPTCPSHPHPSMTHPTLHDPPHPFITHPFPKVSSVYMAVIFSITKKTIATALEPQWEREKAQNVIAKKLYGPHFPTIFRTFYLDSLYCLGKSASFFWGGGKGWLRGQGLKTKCIQL